MKILYVTNMYPTESNPVSGIFVKEQIEDATRFVDLTYDIHLVNGAEKGKLEYLRSIFQIRRKIARGNYDLVHIHYGLSGLWRLFYRPRIPVFLTLHGGDILRKKENPVQVAITRRLLPKIDRVFTLNEEMNAIVSRYTDAYEMLPCSVNTELFTITEPPAATPEKLLVFPGSPRRRVKNFPLFERVVECVRQRSGLEIRFAVLENLTRTGVRDLMNQADCLVMTSYSEGSPQAVKEALSCGLPVVSVEVGDVSRMLADLPSCAVCPSREPEVLAARVLDSFGADRRAIRNGFLAKEIYDHVSISRRWAELYGRSNGIKPAV